VTIPEFLDEAVAHHRAGRLQAAEQAYRQVLQVDPEQADALHGLGVLAYQAGRYDAALAHLGRAVAVRPESGAFHCNFGLASLAVGRIDQAVAALRRAVELLPDAAEPYFNLGNALKEQGNLDDACACYRQALALKPDHYQACNNLGNALRSQGRLDLALDGYLRALQLRPDYAEAWTNLGNLLRDQGKPDEAETCCRRAVELKPAFPVAWNNLGNALTSQGRTEEAEASYRRALEIAPGFVEAYRNLAAVLVRRGRLDEAVACQRRAVELRPDFAEAHASLGNALMMLGRLDEGDACYRRALELQPAFARAHSEALHWRQYRPGVTLASLAADHAEWDRRHGRRGIGFQSCQSDGDRTGILSHGGRPLRLGLVSADFGRHPVGYFCIRALEALARAPEAFDIVCYSTCWRNDDLTARFRSAARLWREVGPWPDDAIAAQIAADGVDVLFDLAGHTAGNRLPVFARKPAPVQITWIGSEGTTGLSAMDYVLADEHVIPRGAESHYRERVLRLPDAYVCYEPPPDAPAVGPLPALARGAVTFGSFNNPSKLHAEVAAVWARILQRVPGSRLVLKYRCLTDAGLRRRILDLFAAHGIPPGRLELSDWSPHVEMLQQYNAIDLALDPFPFAGGATTCEALWMGVPVITRPGETFASRHSLSYLSAVGLTDTVARDLDDYVEIAVAWAAERERLAAVRAGLRARMAASPLCDGSCFGEHLGALLRALASRERQRPEDSER
jgi:predicted O-linked N-acetylglucosamine transferase (SPINDLY family)